MKRSKSLTRGCANPLFEKWLTEWRDEARAKGSSVEMHFARAIESLQKYPLRLATGRDCILLQHFGVKLCEMLDNRLKKHSANDISEARNSNTESDNLVGESPPKKSWIQEENLQEEKQTKAKTKRADFVPNGKASFPENREKKRTARKTKENDAVGERTNLVDRVSPEMPKSQEKAKSVKRRSRVHSLSSSDSEDPSTAPSVVQIIEAPKSIANGISEKRPLSQIAGRNIPVEKKGKVGGRAKGKKKIQADVESATRTVDDGNTEVGDQFHMAPGSFDVILLVDIHETGSGKSKSKEDPTLPELERLQTPHEVRHLKVGDFAWVARCRETARELVLPYTVERKRMDDLAASIKDGRFHEQKFRLRQSGIPNVIYMIENHGKNQHLGLPLTTCLQAATNSFVQDGFTVKYTDNNQHSMQYLSVLTTLINRIYKDKLLTSSSKEDLDPHGVLSSKVPLMEFKQFNKAVSKVRTFKVSEMFVRHLLQLKGVSVEKALAIVKLYPTPKILAGALQSAGEGGEKLLAGIKVGSNNRQLGPVLSKSIFNFYTKRSFN